MLATLLELLGIALLIAAAGVAFGVGAALLIAALGCFVVALAFPDVTLTLPKWGRDE